MYSVKHYNDRTRAERIGLSTSAVGKTYGDYENGKPVALTAYVDAQDEADAIAAAHTLWQRDYGWQPPAVEREYHLAWMEKADAWLECDIDSCYRGPGVEVLEGYVHLTVKATSLEQAKMRAIGKAEFARQLLNQLA